MPDLQQLKKIAYSLYAQEDYAKAKTKLDKLCKKDKSDEMLWYTAAMASGNVGKFHDAIEKFKVVLRINPDNIDAMMRLAIAAIQIHQFDTAADYFRRVLNKQPDNPEIHFHLGSVLDETGDFEGAIHHLKQAITIAPDFIQVYNNLGLAYQHNNDYPQALNVFQKYISLNPGDPAAYNNLGIVHEKMSNFENAKQCFQNALDMNPDFADANRNLATLHMALGEFDTARKLLKRAVASKPDFYQAMLEYTQIADENDSDFFLDTMLSHIKRKNVPDSEKIILGFALGKVFNDLADYENAFKYYNQANKLKRKSYSYSTDETTSDFNILKSVFNKDYITKKIPHAVNNKTPIFILGMPRSGTSLVEQILSSHDKVSGAGELPIFNNLLEQHFHTNNWLKLENSLLHLSEELQQQLAREYVDTLQSHNKSNRDFVTDKLPHNFLYIGLIKALLPDAKIIHCRRNPVDTCVSIYTTDFTALHKYAYSQVELAEYYNMYMDLMQHWRDVLPPASIYEIDYETLVSDQQTQTEKLLEYCDLEWQDSCLTFNKTRRVVKTASMNQVNKPVYTTSVNRWKKYETYIGDLLSTLEV